MVLLLLAFAMQNLGGQGKIYLNGYLSEMGTAYRIPDQWLWENNLHNRLNLHLYPTSWLTATVQVRNRFISGNTVRKFPGYADGLGTGLWPSLDILPPTERSATGHPLNLHGASFRLACQVIAAE